LHVRRIRVIYLDVSGGKGVIPLHTAVSNFASVGSAEDVPARTKAVCAQPGIVSAHPLLGNCEAATRRVPSIIISRLDQAYVSVCSGFSQLFDKMNSAPVGSVFVAQAIFRDAARWRLKATWLRTHGRY